MVVTLDPAILLVAHVRRVVASVQRAHVVDDGVQGVGKVAEPVTLLGHERGHVQLRRERYEGRDLLVDQTRVLEALQVEAGHDGQRAHGQLLRRLLVALAGVALDLGTAAQVLGPREPFQAVEQRLGRPTAGMVRLAQVQRDVPERVDRSGHALAVLAHHVTLQTAGEDLVDDAVALRGV